jgi:hypothetical protein
MAFCVNCGSKLLEGAGFCTECGTPIEKAEANEIAPAVPVAEETASAAPISVPAVAELPEPEPAPITEATVHADLQAHVAEATKAFTPEPLASEATISETPTAPEQWPPVAETSAVEVIQMANIEAPNPAIAEPIYTSGTGSAPVVVEAVAAPESTPIATTYPAAAKSGSGLKVILIVFAVIAVIAVAIVGGVAYFGFGWFKEAQQSLGASKSTGEAKAASDPCSLATKEDVSEAFGSTITSAVPHGNKCTYLIASSGNRGITVAVVSGDASTKFKLAVSGARAQPVDLGSGLASGSGPQAAYAYGTLYFYQNDTFVTLYMSGAYAGGDANEKAAAIARKMLAHM